MIPHWLSQTSMSPLYFWNRTYWTWKSTGSPKKSVEMIFPSDHGTCLLGFKFYHVCQTIINHPAVISMVIPISNHCKHPKIGISMLIPGGTRNASHFQSVVNTALFWPHKGVVLAIGRQAEPSMRWWSLQTPTPWRHIWKVGRHPKTYKPRIMNFRETKRRWMVDHHVFPMK